MALASPANTSIAASVYPDPKPGRAQLEVVARENRCAGEVLHGRLLRIEVSGPRGWAAQTVKEGASRWWRSFDCGRVQSMACPAE